MVSVPFPRTERVYYSSTRYENVPNKLLLPAIPTLEIRVSKSIFCYRSHRAARRTWRTSGTTDRYTRIPIFLIEESKVFVVSYTRRVRPGQMYEPRKGKSNGPGFVEMKPVATPEACQRVHPRRGSEVLHACAELGWIETDWGVPKEINHRTYLAIQERFSLSGGLLPCAFPSTEANCRGTRTSSKQSQLLCTLG
jgi:hypothetical protein